MWRMPKSLLLTVALLCPLFTSCVDSDNPLTNPEQAKVDTNLLGTWRLKTKAGTEYYHVGKAGEKFPDGMLRIIITHFDDDGVLSKPNCDDTLAFTTNLGDNHFLNITGLDAEKAKTLAKYNWKPSMAEGYFIYKYEVKGDKVEVAAIDRKIKEETIQAGKIKGIIDDNKVRLTDTTDNLAKFFATQDAQRLFFTKEAMGEGFAVMEKVK